MATSFDTLACPTAEMLGLYSASSWLQEQTSKAEGYNAEARLLCNPDASVTIKAAPMTLGAYMELRGWKLGRDENPNQLGYLVERPDMGPANQKGFDHFIAWVEKHSFERFYEPSGHLNS